MARLEKLASLIPLAEIEQKAQQQIYAALELDFLKKLAIMPDVHAGYDLPIGGVALLEGKVSPSFVGYDIGCGMCYIDTEVPAKELLGSQKAKEKLFKRIYQRIPTGVGGDHQDGGRDYQGFVTPSGDKNLGNMVNARLNRQLGTLGSGNHFIEIGETQEGSLAVTLHSGSRGVGYAIAEFYMKKGRFLGLEEELGQAYLADMDFALEYALANRKAMMEVLLELLGFDFKERAEHFKSMVNENHNHALLTDQGVLHRKGATPAEAGQIGIIPANMRDGVFVTRGLGNEEFLSSASHGAGRVLSRKAAKERLELKAFQTQMQKVVAKVEKSTLDEAPMAYKKIETVLAEQEGRVIEVIDRVRPLVNVKA